MKKDTFNKFKTGLIVFQTVHGLYKQFWKPLWNIKTSKIDANLGGISFSTMMGINTTGATKIVLGNHFIPFVRT